MEKKIKKESALERFMRQKPILYGVIVMTALAVLCGAILGVAGVYLRPLATEGIGDREKAILAAVMPSEAYELFENDGKDYAADKAANRVERVYIATGAQNKNNVAIMASGMGYNSGAIKSIVAFNKADDKILGLKVYSTKTESGQTFDQGFREAYWDSFAGKSADDLAKSGSSKADITSLGLSDVYTGATLTAGGIVQGASNAAKFYLKYKSVFAGGALTVDKTVEAIRKLYPSAPDAPNYDGYKQIGTPDGITVYTINRIPFIEAAIGGTDDSVMIYCTNLENAAASVTETHEVVQRGTVAPDAAAVNTAVEAGKAFWADNHGTYVKIAGADPEKAHYDKIMAQYKADSGATAAYSYEPALGSKIGGAFDAVLRNGASYVYRIVKAAPDNSANGNTCYIAAASATSFAGTLVSFTLIEHDADGAGHTGVSGYYVRDVLVPEFDANQEHGLLDCYLNSERFYLYKQKFSEPIKADTYTASALVKDPGNETSVTFTDPYEGEQSGATMSFNGITGGALAAIKNFKETFM
ncbi:hypothetical protein FACS1894211_08180 [Clostridia bacterium]|nr:hypothetical protein FACS1894211_08180 [Clostridia bacterium]